MFSTAMMILFPQLCKVMTTNAILQSRHNLLPPHGTVKELKSIPLVEQFLTFDHSESGRRCAILCAVRADATNSNFVHSLVLHASTLTLSRQPAIAQQSTRCAHAITIVDSFSHAQKLD